MLFKIAPLPLLVDPTFFGLLPTVDYVHNVAMIWLVVGIGGLLSARCTFFLRGVQTGLVWMLKILTDPFHDLKLYWKAPLALLAASSSIRPSLGSRC